MKKITNIAITGGPCGGKTTVMAFLRQKLEEKGFIVTIVPEAATLCINGGLSPASEILGPVAAQTAITTVAYQMEEVWHRAALTLAEKANVVILYDRGITDSSAYAPREMYEGILKSIGLNPVYVRDQRYHGVIHLVTAANGAEEFYTLKNNTARLERTAELARMQDEKTIAAWNGHPHRRIVDNSTGFDEKIRRAYREVCGILGMPPIEYERKFVVSFDRKDIPAEAQVIDIEQFYVVSADPSTVVRLRRWGQRGFYTYYRTTKQSCGKGKNIEIEDFTTQEKYEFGRDFMRPDAAVVRKTRTCFAYQNQSFELDTFEDAWAIPQGDGLLELEITDDSRPIRFPPWMKVGLEVTGNPLFSNFGIAQALLRRD